MIWILFLVVLLFALRRELTYLHIFQQEEYDSPRFVRWLIKQFAVDKRASAGLLLIGILEALHLLSANVSYVCAAVVIAALTAIESDPRKKGKKPLAMTGRAKRIYWSAVVLILAVAVAIALFKGNVIAWIVVVQAIPFSLATANLFLFPFESRIQKKFWNEAHEKLLRLKPTIIGITGSYGKTSVKHILTHVLGISAPTLATPGSVNTSMGISRIVREQLAPHHRFFICEMGAYGPGSIARLCRLAPPDLAIITAIGPAHYERFKTLDAVVRTKFELAQAAMSRGGKVILAEEILQHSYAAAQVKAQPGAFVLVGAGADCQFRILNHTEASEGVTLEVLWAGKSYQLSSHLFGNHQVLNLVLVFAAACITGIPPEDAQTALNSTPQITHRLEVKQQQNGPTIIDDAYNSNPTGFANGLTLLDILRRDGGRRILVTPGMVELGAVHDEEHRKAGLEAGKHVDVLLAVLPQRIPTLVQAYREANPNGTLVECSAYEQARQWMEQNLQPADVVLLENDLPDLYEKRLRL